MSKFYYDLHIHSCLSPCGDNDSTPDSIAGMGELNSLNLMALTDHNSTKNVPAFFKAAERHSITAVAGTELTTSEDIHALCLFEHLEGAQDFDSMLENLKMPFKNDAQIFGNQLICDENDNILGEEENLLINATFLSLDEAWEKVKEYGGILIPAHIDRKSNSIFSVLGAFPETPKFNIAELNFKNSIDRYKELTGVQNFLVNSDAHYLWDIKEKEDFLELDADINATSDEIRKALFEFLRGAK